MNRAKFPKAKPVMIISDYPIINEIDREMPYSAASNLSMLSDLHKVGIKQSDCHLTYMFYERATKDNFDYHNEFRVKVPTDSLETWHKLEHQKNLYISEFIHSNLEALLHEIELVGPKIIIINGKWSLFLLSGLVSYRKTQGSGKSQKPLGGLSSYRASILTLWKGFNLPECILYPILPAITKQREPAKLPILSWDYRKAGDIFKAVVINNEEIQEWTNPERDINYGTSLTYIKAFMLSLLVKLANEITNVSIDIETRHGTLDCIGFAYIYHDKPSAICIPFSTLDSPSCWAEDEELEITMLVLKVLSDKNIRIIGQNYSYDSQYIHKYYAIETNPDHDTMISNHVLYNYMQKDLAFLASIYCNTYAYWKDMQTHEAEGVK